MTTTKLSKGKRVGLILLIALFCTIGGFYALNNYIYQEKQEGGREPEQKTALLYRNTDYGFTFSLPDSWEGYAIIENTWQGYTLKENEENQIGPKLLIRNPNWTSDIPYQDIPILIFTLDQWDSYRAENFSVSAAPIPATELGRNNQYVFALPPRWNFDYSKGYEEAEAIVQSNPLAPLNLVR